MAKLVGARVYNNADLTIPNDTFTDLTFNSEDYDTDTIHSTGTNTGRLTCQTAGKYLAILNCRFDVNAAAVHSQAQILKGTVAIAHVVVPNDNVTMIAFSCSVEVDLAVGEYVKSRVYQASGGNLNIDATASSTPSFSMRRIG